MRTHINSNVDAVYSLETALPLMKAPFQKGVICVDVTNRCNLGCSNCTRFLENQDGYWDMTPENFRSAVRSLREYPGVIAMIGGNPAMHKEFELLCQIFAEEIPEKSKRGLWSNNVFKHAELAAATFGTFNMNTHGDTKGTESLRDLYLRTNKKGNLFMGNSIHAPLLTALKDLYPEQEMWQLISQCDINQRWSGTIIQNNGKLRAYFCEVAGSFDVARGEDFGHEVVENWWKRPIEEYVSQIQKFCPGCGAAAKFKGSLDNEETDMYTISNLDLVKNSEKRKRKTILITEAKTLELLDRPITSHQKSINKRILIIRSRLRVRSRIKNFFTITSK